MTGATIHTNLVSAFREKLLTLVKATTGNVATLSAAGSVITRSSGSFVTDAFGPGDEVMVEGFATAANNGRANIIGVTSTTLTLDKTLTTEAAGGTRRVLAGLPQGRSWESEDFSPTVGQPFVEDEYNHLPSSPVGIGLGGCEAHGLQAIFAIVYPKAAGRLAISRMGGAVRALFRPGTALFYGGESGTLMASSLNGRIVSDPNWLRITVQATASARTTG